MGNQYGSPFFLNHDGVAKYTGAHILELSEKIVGTKINRLTILEYLGIEKGKSKIKTECECGTISIQIMNVVLRGKTKSCGCLAKEVATTHGLRKHPLYGVWHAMVRRCYDEKDNSYRIYGAIGVRVCDEWRNDFIAFYNWAISNGWKKGLNLDKDIKGDGKLYSPQTCYFATRALNNRNTSNTVFVTYGGRTATMKEWSIMLNIPYDSFTRRIKKGNIEKAITTPYKPYARC